jgi:hypothetical protein
LKVILKPDYLVLVVLDEGIPVFFEAKEQGPPAFSSVGTPPQF